MMTAQRSLFECDEEDGWQGAVVTTTRPKAKPSRQQQDNPQPLEDGAVMAAREELRKLVHGWAGRQPERIKALAVCWLETLAWELETGKSNTG